ncbi:hypothetical protein I7I53_04458 [Histoplasma capsulatum var. duboisii H88]|uniref:Fungal STAND N-terminal Goodbye domain-containing protein n=1 Tax=Ajellomyces capsulatus (strain H88) TaxID=544711 RepID=A0A8A1LPS8_AJEC8|nr:hypothetical protein I7I53_04458 [Histoplasma capsulatum var. duboisii H88]
MPSIKFRTTASEASNSTNSHDAPPSRRCLGGLADLYLRKRLTRDSHPALKAVRDDGEATSDMLLVPTAPGTTSDISLVQQQSQNGINEQIESDDEGDALQDLYIDVEAENKRFKTALEEYESTTAGSKFQTDVTTKSAHTWEEVLQAIKNASDEYNDVSGFWGRIRKGLRSFGKNHKAFKAWASILPSQSHYFSLLCAGFKLILGAAARLHDLRTDISDALTEIPLLISSTHKALGIFRRSNDLRRSSAALYTATIAALHHIVVWYKEKASKKLFRSIFKQDTYEKELSDLLKAVRDEAKEFERVAQLCSYDAIMNARKLIMDQGDESRKHREIVLGYFDQSRNEFQDFRDDFKLAAGGVNREVKLISNEVSQLRRVLAGFLSSNARMDFKIQDVKGPMLPLRRAVSEANLVQDYLDAKNELLSDFDYESSVVRNDIDASLEAIWALPRCDQDRAVAVMQSPKLHSWITEPSSSALLVNFNDPKKTASTSFISAKLTHSIQSDVIDPHYPRNIFALFFLCAEHIRPDDPDYGVSGMMRNLIGQLLIAYPDFGMSVIKQIQRTGQDDIRSLCQIFHMMIAQLPPYVTVFCVLDAITVYEQNGLLHEEGEYAVQELMSMVQWTKDHGCDFKILLTSAWNSHVFYKYVPDRQKDIIWIPAKVPPQGGFTRMKWDSSVASGVGMLAAPRR